MHKYLLSVIMPVYNSALYLDEAIESIISQSLGFEKIQLILVNDGSTDNSLEIIQKYASKHENIAFIDKENGGVSSARNAGLALAQGKYITFPDPDDTISKNAYKDVIGFFEKNYDSTNVVSFPIYFFGDSKGEHPLNYKFKNGQRIIDLTKEDEFQLHITSSVIKAERALKMHFKPELVVSEDAEALLRLLIDTPRLGVVPSAHYNYRKRQGSLLATAQSKPEYYLPHMEHYFKSIVDYAIKKHNELPRFIQSAIAYELSWKLTIQDTPEFLTREELLELEKRIFSCLAQIEPDILKKQNLPQSTIQYVLLKTGREVAECDFPYILEFIDTCGDKIKITVRTETPMLEEVPNTLIAFINGKKSSVFAKTEVKARLLGKEIVKRAMGVFEIPIAELENSATIYFSSDTMPSNEVASSITLGKHFPLEKRYKNAYSPLDKLIISCDENALIFERSSKKALKSHERAFRRELWRSNAFAERKAVLARALSSIYKRFHKKPLWLISDRLSVASDNGEALFEYLSKNKPNGISIAFSINKGKDYSRLKKIGRVVDRASLKYKIMHLCADMIISSHAEDFVTNPFDYYSAPYKDILVKKPFVFLQHGVTKDNLSAWLDKFNKNIKGFVCSSRAEYESILHTYPYHYTENELWLTGMPRFDKLSSMPERQIVLMPTWRRYLVSSIDIATGRWQKSSALEKSEYVSFWKGFIESEELLGALEKHNYTLCVVPHPNLDISEFIHTSPRVRIEKAPSYTKLYEKSALLVTDYSSVAFDMAYLDKPIIYAQFDVSEFFSGEHTYGAGYFDYEKNGFGKVANTLDEVVSLVIQCIENECALEPKYRDRINEFFEYRDGRACERVVQRLLDM